MAGPGSWLAAQAVVRASLEGLRRNKLFVIPGWRYRVLTAVLPKLPAALRLGVQNIVMRDRAPIESRQLP